MPRMCLSPVRIAGLSPADTGGEKSLLDKPRSMRPLRIAPRLRLSASTGRATEPADREWRHHEEHLRPGAGALQPLAHGTHGGSRGSAVSRASGIRQGRAARCGPDRFRRPAGRGGRASRWLRRQRRRHSLVLGFPEFLARAFALCAARPERPAPARGCRMRAQDLVPRRAEPRDPGARAALLRGRSLRGGSAVTDRSGLPVLDQAGQGAFLLPGVPDPRPRGLRGGPADHARRYRAFCRSARRLPGASGTVGERGRDRRAALHRRRDHLVGAAMHSGGVRPRRRGGHLRDRGFGARGQASLEFPEVPVPIPAAAPGAGAYGRRGPGVGACAADAAPRGPATRWRRSS